MSKQLDLLYELTIDGVSVIVGVNVIVGVVVIVGVGKGPDMANDDSKTRHPTCSTMC